MSKIINEKGNIYHYLKVIERGPNDKKGQATWTCECKCGKIINVTGYQLRSGKTKSCGCYQKEQTAKANYKDLTGQTIGNFTVLEYNMGGHSYGGAKWRCKCNLCGNENFFISSNNLTKQESCGCINESKGSRKIKEILEENNIKYIQEKRFASFKFEDSGKLARYDFFLPEYDCLIEYDGVQHFKQGNGIYDNELKFKKTQEHDTIKNEWAKQNGYRLIRIPYTHLDNIILNDLLPSSSKYNI